MNSDYGPVVRKDFKVNVLHAAELIKLCPRTGHCLHQKFRPVSLVCRRAITLNSGGCIKDKNESSKPVAFR